MSLRATRLLIRTPVTPNQAHRADGRGRPGGRRGAGAARLGGRPLRLRRHPPVLPGSTWSTARSRAGSGCRASPASTSTASAPTWSRPR
nr:hypothetical protein [Angustibacter aerolatus]